MAVARYPHGISYNKFPAKLASDHRKPDDLFVITPKMGPACAEKFPVGKFHGVRPATVAKMNRLGIETGLDLGAQTISFLRKHFCKWGPYFYWIARGIDDRPVRADRIRKSVGAENTFSVDLFTFEAAQDALLPIGKLWRHCETSGAYGRRVTLKIKYADFQQVIRSLSLPMTIEERGVVERIAIELLEGQFPEAKGIRLLGISISALGPAYKVDAEQPLLGI